MTLMTSWLQSTCLTNMLIKLACLFLNHPPIKQKNHREPDFIHGVKLHKPFFHQVKSSNSTYLTSCFILKFIKFIDGFLVFPPCLMAPSDCLAEHARQLDDLSHLSLMAPRFFIPRCSNHFQPVKNMRKF